MSEKSIHYGKFVHDKMIADAEKSIALKVKAEHSVLTPEEIADYIHDEFTPYASMTPEEGKEHIAELIHRYAIYFREKILTENDIVF